MTTLDTVLAAVDLSPSSETVLAQAQRIAQNAGAKLHVLHVLHDRVISELAGAVKLSPEAMRLRVQRDAEETLAKLVAKLGATPTTAEVAVGTPIELILDRTKSVAADLLVMGVYGASGPGRGAGSIATKAVYRSPADVLLVYGDQTGPYTHIVACTDFTETSRRAVDRAARVASTYQSQLDLLHVYWGPWRELHFHAPTSDASPEFRAQYTRQLQTHLERELEPHVAALAGLQVKAELLEAQSYGNAIVEYAKRSDADLMVLGTSHSALRYMFLGSTADRVLREVSCSVLAVRPVD